MKKMNVIFALIVLITAVMPANNVFAAGEEEYDYTLDMNRPTERRPISKAYTYVRTIDSFAGEIGKFDGVQDVFIDHRDILYIVDTENSRIIRANRDGTAARSFSGPEDKPLNKPEGIFVDQEGDMFVADTGNNRIVHLDPEGGFVEEFAKPDSPLLEGNFVYNPRKVAVSPTGYLYSIKYQLLMQTDAYNQFRGYVGSTRVGFDFKRMLIRIFASREQKSKLAKVEPPPYTNFIMGDDGFIYATTLDYKEGQIKKLNSVGENIYKKQFFGERSYNRQGWMDQPVFEDIAVDAYGVISAIDRVSAKVYQYDPEGNLLAVFGGRGSQKGMLSLPKCIDVDSEGNIFVYDTNNNILVFKPTKFIKTVHEAIKNYSNGEYDTAMTYWQQTLEICETYNLAHIGIGKTYFKKKMYREAMDEYLKAMDKAGYTQAFVKYRYETLRQNFSWVFFLTLVCVILFVLLVKGLYKLSFVCEEKYKKNRGMA